MSGGQIPPHAPRARPVVLCVLDGWGWREDAEDNAIAAARTPNYDRLLATCPHGLLRTAAGDVGLPEDQMGNSEVGHLIIGFQHFTHCVNITESRLAPAGRI